MLGKILAIDDDPGVLDTYRSILHTQVYESDALLALAGLPDVSIVKPNVLNPEVAATIERLTTKADRSDGSGGGHRFDSI